MKNFYLATFLIIASSILIPYLVQANGLVPCGPGTTKPICELCDFFVLFDNVVDFVLLKITFPLAILMIAIGGFMYMFAYFGGAEMLPGGGKGGSAMLGQAKKLITSVVMGLLIIFAAWLIVGFFLSIIGLNPDWTLPMYRSWWEQGFYNIPCP